MGKEKKIVCKCNKVTVKDVKTAVKNGAKNIDEVAKVTGLGSSCKRCRQGVAMWVEELVKKRKCKKSKNY